MCPVTLLTLLSLSLVQQLIPCSVSVSLAGLSPGVYAVKVASVDYANRTGSYSNVLSFELKGLMIKFFFYSFTIIACFI